MAKSEKLRLAAVGDLHCMKDSQGFLQKLLAEIPPKADILLLCGDLTDTGTPEEARVLAKELKTTVNIPIVAVLGNHDFHSGKQQEVEAILSEAGIVLLNGEARYTWARGPMGRDYVGFKRIDLSGLAVTAGLSLRL